MKHVTRKRLDYQQASTRRFYASSYAALLSEKAHASFARLAIHRSPAFTIVELLIVIVIIAILAAVTVVAYNGIQNRANDSSVQSDLRMIAKKLELARIDDPNNFYPKGNDSIATLARGIKVAKGSYQTSPTSAYNLLFCWPGNGQTDYFLLAISKSGKRMYVHTTGTVVEYTGATSWDGSNIGAMCDSVSTASSAAGAGYSAGDAITGPWRAWTGV